MKRIVVDSSASLYALDGIDFAAVPLKIVTDEREYLDDGTLDAVEMATTLRTYKGKTSTSCPNIGDWLEAYEGADEIYAITITGTLSGSCNAAQLAAEEYQAEHPGAQVFVLDSDKSLERELLLLKVASDVHNRTELREIAGIYKAKIIDLSPDSMVFELIGKPDKIDAFLKMFTDYKILEQCRTGVTALERGGMHQHMQKPPQEVREAQLPLPGTHCPERK